MEESLSIEIQETDQHLVAIVSGKLTYGNTKELIDLLESESSKRGYDLFLVDMLQTGPPEKEIHRFYLGEYAASTLRKELKVDIVYPEELINKFFENTAVNRGATLTVVSDRVEALSWLLEQLPEQSDKGVA
jgi:hypothetical protein